MIPPALSYKIETKVVEIIKNNDMRQFEVEQEKIIRVFVIRKGQAQPVLAATINMPPTEVDILV